MGTRQYHEEYIPIQQEPLLLLQQLVQTGLLSNYFLYQQPQEVRIVGNPWITVSVSAEEVIQDDGHRIKKQPINDPLKQVEHFFSTLSIENWTAYGYISFDFSGFYYPYSKAVEDQPLLHFFVPQTELSIRPDGVSIKTVESIESLKKVVSQSLPNSQPFHQKLNLKELPNTLDYIDQVQKLIDAIQQGKLHKAILSQSIQFQQ